MKCSTLRVLRASACGILLALPACSAMSRATSPGPARASASPPPVTEYDILRLRIMERMANGSTKE